MTASIPTTEPSTITPGDTVKWTRTLADYPATDGWALSYEFVNSTHRYTASASASGADHAVTISASISVTYAAGDYAWRARVTKGSEVYTVGTGRATVMGSFAAATDARSQARRMLEAIEATLEGRASSATEMYEIQTTGGGMRKLKYIPVPDLLKLRDRLRADVAREDAIERAKAGLPNPGRIYVRHV